jgi:tetratricopeptide (TPR) repeat protein
MSKLKFSTFALGMTFQLVIQSSCQSTKKIVQDDAPIIQASEVVEKSSRDEETQRLLGDHDGLSDDDPLPPKGSKVDVIFSRATEKMLRAEYNEAARDYESAAEMIPGFFVAHHNAALAYQKAEKNEKAVEHYRKALEIKAYHAKTLVNLYLLLEGLGQSAAANELVDQALREHDQRAGPHVAAATRARLRQDTVLAENEARLAIQYNERQVEAMRIMAWVFSQRGQFETSRFALENALILEPGNGLLRLDLAHVLLKLEEKEAAREQFRLTASLRPDFGEAFEYYAVLTLETGNAERALAAMEKAVRLRASSAQTQLNYGNALRGAGRYEDALRAYDKALAIQPALREAFFNKALIYMDNDVESLELLVRLEKSRNNFTQFTEGQNLDQATKLRVEDYLANLDRQIKREERSIQRELDRQAEEERKAAEAAQKAASGASSSDDDDWGEEDATSDGGSVEESTAEDDEDW